MASIGIAVRAKNTRPLVRGVVLEEDGSTRTFEHFAAGTEDQPAQIHSIADAVRTELTGVTSGIDAVVMREADDGARGGLTKGRKARARGEGAVLDAVRALTPSVAVMNGPQVGRACGGNLAYAEAQAADLALGEDWIVAASAAIAARSLVAS